MKAHTTRSHRARRRFWRNLGIWIFLGIFAFSVVGGLIVFIAGTGPR